MQPFGRQDLDRVSQWGPDGTRSVLPERALYAGTGKHLRLSFACRDNATDPASFRDRSRAHTAPRLPRTYGRSMLYNNI